MFGQLKRARIPRIDFQDHLDKSKGIRKISVINDFEQVKTHYDDSDDDGGDEGNDMRQSGVVNGSGDCDMHVREIKPLKLGFLAETYLSIFGKAKVTLHILYHSCKYIHLDIFVNGIDNLTNVFSKRTRGILI